ncbi:MAG: CDP-diacylglycerol--serine O-phosphatidyltransferase [Pseudomonadota bacterium]
MKRRKNLKNSDKKRGIYILPNLVTSANLFCGFYSIVAAMQGHFVKSSIAIMVAAIFDNLDGKVARATRSESPFGVEYDSLCDLVSFGVAPAMLAYLWALKPFGRLGWLAAFLFVACGALRLARFNTLKNTVSSEYFLGLPIPAAAGMIATTILFWYRMGKIDASRNVVLLVMIYGLSFLMVSAIRYYSFKKSEPGKGRHFNTLVTVVLILSFVAYEPSIALFGIGLIYIASGPVSILIKQLRPSKVAQPDKIPEGLV